MSDCNRPTCTNPAGQQDRDDYRTSFCSIQCEVRHDHIRADARDAQRQEVGER